MCEFGAVSVESRQRLRDIISNSSWTQQELLRAAVFVELS